MPLSPAELASCWPTKPPAATLTIFAVGFRGSCPPVGTAAAAVVLLRLYLCLVLLSLNDNSYGRFVNHVVLRVAVSKLRGLSIACCHLYPLEPCGLAFFSTRTSFERFLSFGTRPLCSSCASPHRITHGPGNCCVKPPLWGESGGETSPGWGDCGAWGPGLPISNEGPD